MKSENVATEVIETIIPIAQLASRLPQLSEKYQNNQPFPHIVLENFLVPEFAMACADAFPGYDTEAWINYMHFNEHKRGLNKFDQLPEPLQKLIHILHSGPFMAFLEKLTGIPDLLADPSLEGGGLHATPRGGYLNIHADFLAHTHDPFMKRRINLLIYLNPDWKEEYAGALELWSKDMKQCVRKYYPFFNQCVVFTTDAHSYHGVPDPLQCPDGESRKSVALYYYNRMDRPLKIQGTNYKSRPQDGAKAFLIRMDTWMVNSYSKFKRATGINDQFASKLLKVFFGKRKK